VLGSKTLIEVFRNRIDVTSPGVLPNHMTVASALAGGHPRTHNELIANYMTARGLMEVRGRGLPIIAREMREWNGTQPTMVSSDDGRFRAAHPPFGRALSCAPSDGGTRSRVRGPLRTHRQFRTEARAL
jgi:predicted HTH transcriptional regulator